MKLILPATYLPDRCIVTKPNGTKQLTLVNEIKIHGTNQIIGGEGIKYLIDERGNINAIPEDTDVGIEFTSFVDLVEFLENNADTLGDIEEDEDR